MKKKLIAMGLAGMMLLGSLAGCGGGGDTPPADTKTPDTGSSADSNPAADKGNSGDKLKVAISMACRDQFLSTLETATVEAAKEAGNVDLTTFDANNDISAQLGHVQTCAAGGYDAVIVNLVNTDSAPEIVDLAGDMKVVFVNRLPSDESVLKDNVMYCGSRESDAGTMQGEYLAKYFKDQGKTEANGIMIMGTLGLSHTVARTDYAKKALEDGGIKVNWVFEDTADFDRAKAMDKMTQVLGDANKKFDFIVCNADDMALGCIEAIKAASGEVTVPIVGIDGGATGCKAIQDGDMAFTVFQNPVGQGEGAITCIEAMCKGEPVDGADGNILWIPFEPITKDNVSDYYSG
ncbi:substrate-binding domain-containing protein [Intestinibacillus massiliensis]|nr:substrate-binding domain-containing protein [Intestinibacillus massiliensis]